MKRALIQVSEMHNFSYSHSKTQMFESKEFLPKESLNQSRQRKVSFEQLYRVRLHPEACSFRFDWFS